MDFLNVAADVVVEKETDRLGGFRIYDAGVFSLTIKAAFLDKSASGANCVVILLENADGMKYTSTEYITSRIGKNTYVCKKTGKNKLLPGMQKMNSLAELLTGKSLGTSVLEDRLHKVYSKEAGGEVNQPRKTLIDWTGVTVHVGMLNLLVNKREKVGDAYVEVAETRNENEIDKWFNADRQTLAEVQAGSAAKFVDDWSAQNQGKVRDKTNKNLAKAGAPTAGAPVAGAPLSFT